MMYGDYGGPNGLVGLAVLAVALWMGARVLVKAGYSGWWVLLALVPLVNIVMLWVFAFSRWPALPHRQ